MTTSSPRLLRRIDLPDHNWKFSAADVRERARWDDYQKAFSEMLTHTSTEWAPWYVIPADRKWFGRIAAGAVLVEFDALGREYADAIDFVVRAGAHHADALALF